MWENVHWMQKLNLSIITEDKKIISTILRVLLWNMCMGVWLNIKISTDPFWSRGDYMLGSEDSETTTLKPSSQSIQRRFFDFMSSWISGHVWNYRMTKKINMTKEIGSNCSSFCCLGVDVLQDDTTSHTRQPHTHYLKCHSLQSVRCSFTAAFNAFCSTMFYSELKDGETHQASAKWCSYLESWALNEVLFFIIPPYQPCFLVILVF